MVPVRLVTLLTLFTLSLLAADYFPPPDSKGGWRTKADPALTAKMAFKMASGAEDMAAYLATMK